MSAMPAMRLRVSGLSPPILRALPALFTYARLTLDPKARSCAPLDAEFQNNAAALCALVETLCREAGVPEDSWRDLLGTARALTRKSGAALAAALDDLCAALTSLHESAGKELKRAASADPERYRALYRQIVRPKRVLAVFCHGTEDQDDALERKLADRGYFDYESVTEDWEGIPSRKADIVLVALHERPVSAGLMAMVQGHGVPILILVGGEAAKDTGNMALLKTEYLYRKSGASVLRSPFAPVRLYSTMDALYLRHLADRAGQTAPLEAAAAG